MTESERMARHRNPTMIKPVSDGWSEEDFNAYWRTRRIRVRTGAYLYWPTAIPWALWFLTWLCVPIYFYVWMSGQ